MKKSVSLILSIVLLFYFNASLSACNNDNNAANSNTKQPPCSHCYVVAERNTTCTNGGYATYQCSLCGDSYQEYEQALGHTTDHGVCSRCGKTICSHNYVAVERKATCTNGGFITFQCSLCGDSYQEYEQALGHTTDHGVCSRCWEKIEAEIWKTAFYVDEFNNPTNTAYIRNVNAFEGTFSNSATTNSRLYALILIDTNDIAIKLWEYGSLLVKASSTTYYDITILDDNGNKHYTSGTMYKNTERIYLKDKSFVSLLQQNQKLKVYIEEDTKYYKSTYLFEVENENFNTVYSDFYNQYIK